jgi:hypothetical protein
MSFSTRTPTFSSQFHPDLCLPHGSQYHQPRLWEDLYSSVNDARHFIYVAGWSVNTQITLVNHAKIFYFSLMLMVLLGLDIRVCSIYADNVR